MQISIVCGLHRSGTTFVGELLRRADFCVAHEPLNERFGMVDVPIAYPYVATGGGQFSQLIDDSVTLSRPWNKTTTYISAKGLHRKIYALTGGRSGIRWNLLRLRQCFGVPPPNICLKDPFMSLATPYLVGHHGLKVLCMVRHPAAIHYSTQKKNWCFEVDNLLQQQDLAERFRDDIPYDHWELARSQDAASIAILWKLMVRLNAPLAKMDGNLLIVRHEELCLDPIVTTRRICGHLHIPFTAKLEKFIVDHSNGVRVEAQFGKTHDFKRDSKSIPLSWKGKISAKDEKLILDIAGEEIFQVYGPASK